MWYPSTCRSNKFLLDPKKVPHVTIWLVGARLTNDVANSTCPTRPEQKVNKFSLTCNGIPWQILSSSKELELGLLAFITVISRYASAILDQLLPLDGGWLMWDRSLPCIRHNHKHKHKPKAEGDGQVEGSAWAMCKPVSQASEYNSSSSQLPD